MEITAKRLKILLKSVLKAPFGAETGMVNPKSLTVTLNLSGKRFDMEHGLIRKKKPCKMGPNTAKSL